MEHCLILCKCYSSCTVLYFIFHHALDLCTSELRELAVRVFQLQVRFGTHFCVCTVFARPVSVVAICPTPHFSHCRPEKGLPWLPARCVVSLTTRLTPAVEALQKLRRTLTEMCSDFSNSLYNTPTLASLGRKRSASTKDSPALKKTA